MTEKERVLKSPELLRRGVFSGCRELITVIIALCRARTTTQSPVPTFFSQGMRSQESITRKHVPNGGSCGGHSLAKYLVQAVGSQNREKNPHQSALPSQSLDLHAGHVVQKCHAKWEPVASHQRRSKSSSLHTALHPGSNTIRRFNCLRRWTKCLQT